MAASNAQQQSYGIKIAQPGFNALNCPDYDLIFNSSWPSLAIAFDQVVTVTYNNLGVPSPTSITHNLGFYPLTMAWQFSDSTMTTSLGRLSTSSINVGVNDFFIPAALGVSTTVYLNIKAYNLDISQPQNYNYIQPPATNLPYDKTYGIKVSKQGKSTSSTDLRDFILHSRAASPQVLAVVTEATNYNTTTNVGNDNGVLFYQNPQGYLPWVFAYGAVTSNNQTVYEWAPPYAQAYPTVSFTSLGEARLPLSNNPAKGSIIALRDPLFAAQYTQVIY